ncbi:hypothetical protein L336_0069 [Candidatus Saccharimonas aalborgensis]|jgi:membrane protease YdiL (CAAX protease family)|uniref:Uncharacterized protein n=1 Tax=Candidatus Saccharimonas aalborgensis TaxID=1332188 RepID=R4PUH0_9BACT|nr:DUF5665 domain-containing protein [Candidatus Saccharimonas aalborgensis]AGL61780.1 hypothetical protein L336_0069 [Candidatus Saccharimonas aalborgensis]QQR51578.1 MAG: hypothetical protein IPF89_01975 [Candidatus Saccharibacteria bacterium]QQS68312.1 MAG: hypothetical protein IPP24_04880 [Candidatus Saccharibacteria bacterium]QQS70636.1 MAG: hypothetical protein IPP92_04885 [Candidatus Saccharibacteria bacterium]
MAEKKQPKQPRAADERDARQAVIEDLFNDFNRNRFSVYKINFIRGVFFGFGSFLGATLLVALFVSILTLLSGWVPPIGDFLDKIVRLLTQK